MTAPLQTPSMPGVCQCLKWRTPKDDRYIGDALSACQFPQIVVPVTVVVVVVAAAVIVSTIVYIVSDSQVH